MRCEINDKYNNLLIHIMPDLPEICLSGRGGIGINENFSSNLSCNQSKCLYRRSTAILLN